MANGNGKRGAIGASGWLEGLEGDPNRTKRTRRQQIKRILGMTKRPTTAGQEIFGDVDVTGEQMTLPPVEIIRTPDQTPIDRSSIEQLLRDGGR